MMQFQKLQLSSTVVILAILHIKGLDSTESIDVASGFNGFSFPIVGNQAKRSTAVLKGRSANDVPAPKKGWLHTKGRAAGGDEEDGEESKPAKSSKKDKGAGKPKKGYVGVKHVSSFSFTDEKDEEYDKVIDEAKEEAVDQRNQENAAIDQEAGPQSPSGGGDSSKPIRSGQSKLFELRPQDQPMVDPIVYLKKLKQDFARKNQEEIERYHKRRNLVMLLGK